MGELGPLDMVRVKRPEQQTCLEWWAGAHGNEYTKRNQVSWQSRIGFWSSVINLTGARSVFEMGANAGWNLSAIRRAYPDVRVLGNDINTEACLQASEAGLTVYNELNFLSDGRRAELAFTAGVLIHIEPQNLEEVMRALIAKSYRWVMAVEYPSDNEEMIEYRGEKNRLWKRPYGQLYENMGLRPVRCLENPIGFDRCNAWLLEK